MSMIGSKGSYRAKENNRYKVQYYCGCCVHEGGCVVCRLWAVPGTRYNNSKTDNTLIFLNPAGSIPKELGALSELKQLDLSGNQLTGENLSKIITTDDMWFQLVSRHTHAWVSTPSRGRFPLRKYKFTFALPLAGPIPGTLGAISKLKELVLNINKLTGERG